MTPDLIDGTRTRSPMSPVVAREGEADCHAWVQHCRQVALKQLNAAAALRDATSRAAARARAEARMRAAAGWLSLIELHPATEGGVCVRCCDPETGHPETWPCPSLVVTLSAVDLAAMPRGSW